MAERESMLPLAVSAFVAIGLHVLFIAAIPTLQAWDAAAVTAATDHPQPDYDRHRPKLELGRDHSVVPTSVAWISHDEMRELLARQTDTLQPAVQMQADPTPGAPLLIDATPPTPSDARNAEGSPAPAPDAAPSPPAEAEQSAPMPTVTPPAIPPGDANEPASSPVTLPPSPLAELAAPPALPTPVQPTPPAQAPADAPSEANEPREREPSQQQAADDKSRPTSAARNDRESPPTAIEQSLSGTRTGRVLVMDGLEVRTVAPRVGVVSYLTSAPQDAIVEITFGGDGRVTRVELKQSTRYIDIDAAIESAAYRWRAEGEKLKNAPHTIVVTFRH